MMYNTVISLLARADSNASQAWPQARMRLHNQEVQHQFDSAQPEHRFTIHCSLAPGRYLLEFGHTDATPDPGALRVTQLRLQGADVGMAIYQGWVQLYDSDTPQHSQQTIAQSGRWCYELKIPLEHNHRGVGFV